MYARHPKGTRYGNYLNRALLVHENMQTLLKDTQEAHQRVREVEKENTILAKDLDSLLRRPEVQALLKKDKQEEESFIKDWLLVNTTKKENENGKQASPPSASPATSSGADAKPVRPLDVHAGS